MFGDKPKPSLAGVYSDEAIPMVAWSRLHLYFKDTPSFSCGKTAKNSFVVFRRTKTKTSWREKF